MASSAKKHGLAEYVAVVALLTLAAVTAVTLFREPIRSCFGQAPPRATRPARAAPPPASPR